MSNRDQDPVYVNVNLCHEVVNGKGPVLAPDGADCNVMVSVPVAPLAQTDTVYAPVAENNQYRKAPEFVFVTEVALFVPSGAVPALLVYVPPKEPHPVMKLSL